MSQCDLCGQYAEEVWAVPGEYGKTALTCDACLPQPATREVVRGQKPLCPVCGSVSFADVTRRYWFCRGGGLLLCERQHLFTVRRVSKARTITEKVWVPDD